MDTVRDELDRVITQLDVAAVDMIVLKARIAGLETQRAALLAAAVEAEVGDQAFPPVPGESGTGANGHRTDHIVEVLAAAGEELTIPEVLTELRRDGRRTETYESVASELARLARNRRIVRVKRGMYAIADGTERPDQPADAWR